ncbi:MAG: phosphatidylinositol-specific phospholipase C/glycerophosphodiester phosphodiesterase family protein [Candidatus Hydrogenedentes bacterium]|nr:phosphatidylinositol-specific phospholipase C/glycerophosphodiester phosphodiesterase family protein [Candidatus Hydrogenedentota bacterium]
MYKIQYLAGVAFLLSLTSIAQTPLPNAHAHNDYEHTRPLLDALDHGFCSVEADIYLVDGALLVAHDRKDVKPERTLQALYLDPLRERVTTNNGRVYPNGPVFRLLIDFKSEGAPTYEVLRKVLADYESMLTLFAQGNVEEKAVTIILSGDSPREILKAEPRRLAAIDGRLNDLKGPIDPSLTPLISDSWAGTFKWNRDGEMPKDIRKKLKEATEKAHKGGAIVRFWAIPAREDFWETLLDAGVDLINADDLARLETFLKNR